MKVFIYVDEAQYCGMHGYFDQGVCEVDDIKDAYALGYEWGWELCDSYENLYPYDDYDTELDRIEDIKQSIAVSVYLIRDDIIESVRELDSIAYHLGSEVFIEQYCKQER